MTPKETYNMIRVYGMTEKNNKSYVKKYQDTLRELTKIVEASRSRMKILEASRSRMKAACRF